MLKKRGLFGVLILSLAILSCGGQSSQDAQNVVGTLAALAATETAVAAAVAAPPAAVPPVAPVAPAAPAATACTPLVTANMNAFVRKGPGTVFGDVGTLLTGQTAPIAGKLDDGTWWYINYSAGPGGFAWISASTVTATCLPATVAIIVAPPTPTPSEPAAPTHFKGTASCSPIPATLTLAVHVTLTWTDAATNEEGYRIFRNGALLATLDPNETSFEDDTTLPLAPAVIPPVPPPSVNYGVEAFNGAGKSARKQVDLNCG